MLLDGEFNVLFPQLNCHCWISISIFATPTLLMLALKLTIDNNTTITMQNLPAQLRRIRTRQKHNTSSNLARLRWTTHRTGEILLRLLVHCRRDERSPDRTGRHGIDTDAFADELVGEPAGERYDGSFRAGVVEEIWTADVGVDRGVVDDCVALFHVWEGVFGEVEESCINPISQLLCY